MIGGDADANGDIDLMDKSEWSGVAGTAGYLNTDMNLDARVDNQDKNDSWLNNNGDSSQVPE